MSRDRPRLGPPVRAEAQERGYVAGAIEIAVLLEIEQFDVATDGEVAIRFLVGVHFQIR